MMCISKKQWLGLGAMVLAAVLVIGGIMLWRYESALDQLQNEALAELERNIGQYDDQSIVLMGTSKARAEELAAQYSAKLRITENGRFARLTLPEGTTIRDVYAMEESRANIAEMSADYQVKVSELEEDGERLPTRPEYTVTDSDYERQTYLDYLNMGNAWDYYTGSGVTVAVIDTGIDTDHPEFAGRISEYSYNATEDKIVKDYDDWSLIEDEQGHGTAVTGVIAASMNSGGIVGIAPNVEIIVIKAECYPDGTFARTSDLVFGLYYAIERDVNVVNMSFGTYGINPFAEATQLAVDSDIICVAAAGNDATSLLMYPAADENVIGVGALGDGWELAYYSNYGENTDLVAPGTTYTSIMGGGYGTMTGTSLASPVVAGAMALLLQNNPYTTFEDVTEILYASCHDLGALGRDWDYGFGALDISALVLEDRGTITYDMLTDELENETGIFIQGHTLQELPEPERLYAVFDGWYYDDTFTQEYNYYEDKFYGEVTLYAKWVNEDDGIPYTYVTLDDGTVEIRSYTGHRRYITIPEKIEGKTVSSIGDFAFADQTRLREVTLPSGLTYIGRYAFQNCVNLISIRIPQGVTEIGEAAFQGNTRLRTVAFEGNSKLTALGASAFAYSGLEKIELPAALKYADGSAFFGTLSLQSITVQNVNTAFTSKDGVLFDSTGSTLVAFPAAWGTSYTLPESTIQIGGYAFGYTKLKQVDLAGVQTIGQYAFAFSSLEEVTIPDSVTKMEIFTFFASPNLSSVQIGKGLTEIPEDAFSSCARLQQITIPAQIQTIGNSAFSESGLQSVDFGENSALTLIGDGAFAKCAISEIDIPASVITVNSSAFSKNPLTSVGFVEDGALQIIGGGAFSGCWLLQEIDLPANLTTIGDAAFQGSGLLQVSIPAKVTTLGDGAFSLCDQLTAVTVEAGNTVYHDIDGVVYTLDNTTIHTYPAGKAESGYALLDTTQTVAPWAFAGANHLTTATLPESLTQISEYGFAYCENLQFMNIPDNVMQIGRYAFAYDWNMYSVYFNETAKLPRISFGAFAYSGLSYIRIPASVSTMAQKAFEGCTNLNSITFARNSKLESISAYMFDGCENLGSIYFEEGSALTSIQAHGLEGMDKLYSINFGDAKLTNIDNFAFRFCENLQELNLPDTVTNIGRYAFYGCKHLSELTVPANVEHIGSYAFLGTKDLDVYFANENLPAYLDENWDHGTRGYYTGVTSVVESGDYKYAVLPSGNIAILEYLGSETAIDLTKVDLGGSITVIGGSAFEGKQITSIVLPDTLTQIQAEAFAYSNIKSIAVPANVTFIGRSAFAYTDLEKLTFAAGSKLKVMEQYAFEGTENLKSVTLPASLTTLGTGVFQDSGLESVTFAAGIQITEIPQKAFAETKLTAVTLPDSVTLVNHNAFSNVRTLQSVTFGNNEGIRLMSNAFYHTGLTSLHIPANVTFIGEYCLVALPNLKEFTVDANNPNYTAVDGLLMTKSGRKLIAVPAGRTGSLTVPKSVEEIGFGAFEESKLSEVKFHADANILSLGYRAFFKAENITTITVPASVVSIDYYAFAYCENLTEVIFAEGSQLKGIYEGAFCGDINLEAITIPDTIVEISDFAFYGCSKIDEIPISENNAVKGIYDYAFAYTGIGGELTTPETLIDIGNYAFLGTKLTKVTIPDTNKKDLVIGIGAFEDCNQLTEITLPFIGASYEDDEITWFGYIFGAGSYYANETYIPESLKTVTVTEGIQNLYEGAFFGASGLETINLPTTVSALHQWCFEETTASYSLTGEISIYWDGEPHTMFNNAYQGAGLSGHLQLAEGITELYITTGGSGLTEVTIPDGVTRVSLGGNGITEAYLPDSVTSFSLGGCKNLRSVRFPAGITEIPDYAFNDCDSLVTLDIPDTVTAIGKNAFEGCDSLSYIALPEGITTIEEFTFAYCENLSSITLPSTLTEIDNYAFIQCYALYEIVNHSGLRLSFGSYDYGEIASNARWMIDRDGNKTYLVEGSDAAYVDTPEGFRFLLENGVYTLRAYTGYEETITLPLDIQGQSYEIYEFRGGKHIIIPEGMTAISAGAFARHYYLESITIPDSVTTIGESAFAGCSSLESVKLPAGVTTIAGNLFSNCRGLKEVVIPEGVTHIEWYAFSDCISLESISLPDNLERIGNSVFLNAGLTEIYIPKNVSSMETGAFAGCPMENLTLDPDNDHFTQIDGVLYNSDVTAVVYVPAGITHVTVPATVREIYSAFADCTSLKSVEFAPGSAVTRIGGRAFSGCTALESVSFPENVYSIDYGAFGNCTSLKTIRIPDSVMYIEDNAFAGSGLTEITIPAGVAEIGQDVFWNCFDLKQIQVDPANTAYCAKDGILYDKAMTRIVAVPTGLTGEVVIPEGITEIPWMAFYECRNLTGVTLPESLVSIGNGAFNRCTALRYVHIPEGVETIGESAFQECTALTEITLPKSLTSVEPYTFMGCTNLMSVQIQEGVTTIGTSAFAECKNLTRVTIPESVTVIESNAFYYCPRLYEVHNHSDLVLEFGSEDHGQVAMCALVIVDKNGNRTTRGDGTDTEVIFTEDDLVFLKENGSYTLLAYIGEEDTVTLPLTFNGSAYGIYEFRGARHVILPEGFTEIPYGAFWDCEELESITIPNTVTSIGDWAFNGCENLTNIVIPEGVTSIGASAFGGCTDLAEITVGDSVTNIGIDVVDNTAYANDPANWADGALYLGRYLVDTREDIQRLTVREDTLVIADYAIGSDTLKYLECGIYNFSIFWSCPNIETLVITGGEWYLQDAPITLKNIVIKGDGLAEPVNLWGVSGASIYVDAPEADLRWNDNYPGWNFDNPVIYQGNWIWANFYDREGDVIQSAPQRTAAIVRLPYMADEDGLYTFIGWDVDGDGVADSIPATSTVDIHAYALYKKHEHSYTASVTAPTCTEDGYTTYTCGCGDSYIGDYVEAGHAYGDWQTVTAPTCTEDGLQQRACSACGHSETAVIEATGHAYKSVRTEPTCTAAGYTTHVCTNCGDTYTDEYADALGHDYGAYVSNGDAACTVDGTETAACSRCGTTHTRTQDGSATGHNYVDGACAVCGAPERALGDVNGDEEVDTTDAYLIVQYYNEIMDLDDNQLAAADVDGNGEVDTTDAYYIVQYYNERIDSFPAQ